MALMHEDFFTLGGIFALAGFVVEEFYCICAFFREEKFCDPLFYNVCKEYELAN